MEWLQIVIGVLGVSTTIAVVTGIFVANMRNKFATTERSNYEKALASYKNLLDAKGDEIRQLRDETKELRNMHSDSMREIGKLQGQVDAYSKLPLQEISQNQKVITQIQILIAKHMGVDGLDTILENIEDVHA